MILIVGAGISGLSLAYELLRLGERVKVLESDSIAAGASGIGIAYLEPRFGDTPTRKLEWQSLSLWKDWVSEIERLSNKKVGFFEHGQIRVATASTEDWFEKDWDRRAQEGWQQTRLSQSDISNLEPHLSTSAIHGSFLPEVKWLYGVELCLALSDAITHLGGEIKTNCHISGISESPTNITLTSTDGEQHTGDTAVLANATDASNLLGDSLMNCESVRGIHLYIATPPPYFRHHIKHHRGHLCPHPTPTHEGRVAIGTTYEEGETSLSIPESIVGQVLGNARSILPLIDTFPHLETRAGLRCKIGDGHVRTEKSTDYSRLFYSLGHAGSGFLRAPAISSNLAKLILS